MPKDMNPKDNTLDRYNAWSIGAHWLTFLLLIAVYALMELRGIFPKGSYGRNTMMSWHYMMGLTVWWVVFARLALRFVFRSPPITPEPSAWMKKLALAMHVALYVFLLATPLLGWLTLSAKGSVIPFFGLHMPALLSPDKALAHNIQDIHETIATVGYYLIGLHVAAALFHHYFVRDNTLLRMAPAWTGGERYPAEGGIGRVRD
jgi:cytochrome b561